MILYAVGEIYDKLENIQYTISSLSNEGADIRKSSGSIFRDKDEEFWKCEKCGRLNASYTGTDCVKLFL